MQIKIFFDEKPVYLCDEITPELNEIMHHPDAVFVDELSTPAINALLHEIKKEDFHAGIIWHSAFEKLKKSFFKHFLHIEAAGGIVQNESKDMLFIFRRKKWDLPKGKLEMKELPEECAQREIEEETGVANLHLKKKIGETYHTYNEFGKHILKTSHWYYFTCSNDQTLLPQEAEDITEAKWVKTREIKKVMSNTYENIREIVAKFFDEP
ncbi:MAG: NUDIX domain-containing protein [Chitinophagaceae bacterium]|nr:MAG: NUDIX domain-containing protein [Chitinophagaceae bacterium]